MARKTLPLPRYRVNVSPAVLRWSRETAGLSIEEAAALLPVTSDRLESWEAGDGEADPPTVAQVRAMSEKFHRPISVFLLDQPPAEQLLSTYARRLHGASVEEGSRHLRFAVRAACEVRASALDLVAELGDGAPEMPTIEIDPHDVERSGLAIREAFAITRAQEREWVAERRGLLEWIDHIDAVGVLIMQFGYVEPREQRGFSIVERPLPLIALNELDAPAARLFTLLHEFVHILLSSTSVSVASEALCNAIAAATLMPAAAIDEVLALADSRDWITAGLELASALGVSREAAYRRMATLQIISNEDYEEMRAELLVDPRRKKQRGGPDYPMGEIRRVGRLYIDLVGNAYDRGTISLHDASRRLGVQGRFVEPLIEAAGGRSE